MADIELRRVHTLGLKGARTAAQRMAEHLGRRFDLKGDWKGNVLHFERPGVTGSLAITDKDLVLSVALGFLLKAMKGSIQGAVEQQLDELFARSVPKAGEKPTVPRRPPTKPPKKGR